MATAAVYCPCGSRMSKSTPKALYGQWTFCGSCERGLEETCTIYHCYKNTCYDYCSSCCSSGRPTKTSNDLKYSWNPEPFARGGCRYAYLGIGIRGPLKGQKIVAKKFIDKTAYKYGDWDLDLKCGTKAAELVQNWNKLAVIDKKYIFCEGDIRTLKVKAQGYNGSQHAKLNEFMMIEKYIPGYYEKWNDNSGGVGNKQGSIQAFCHWTYHYSNKTLILCDAQGVRAADAYYITDPAIHSVWQGYGDTDWGRDGIKDFFSTHQCNEFCDSKWSSYGTVQKTPSLPKSTSYRWKTGKLKY